LGLRRGRIVYDFDPLTEPHTLDQFWQLLMAVDAAPIFLRAFDQPGTIGPWVIQEPA